MKHPNVSIVIPCYNQGCYLLQSLESALAQTYELFEVIIVDDGSDDAATRSVINSIQYPDVQIIRTENRGLATARNTGINAARGQYILPLDADDKIDADYLRMAMSVFESHSEYGIVYGRAEFFGAQTGVWNLPDYSLNRMLIGNIIFHCAMFRRADWERVGGYNTNMVDGWEDWDFWLSLIERGCKPYQLDDVVYFYRRKENSMVEKLHQCGRDKFMLMQLMLNHRRLYNKYFPLTERLLPAHGTVYHVTDTENIAITTLIPDEMGRFEFIENIEKFSGGIIRIDPVEFHACELTIDVLKFSTRGRWTEFDLSTALHNGEINVEGSFVFYNSDPFISVNVGCNVDVIHCAGRVKLMQLNEVDAYVTSIKKLLMESEESVEMRERELKSVYSSLSWNMTKPLRRVVSKIRGIKGGR